MNLLQLEFSGIKKSPMMALTLILFFFRDRVILSGNCLNCHEKINKAELKLIQTLFLSSGLLSMLTEGLSILDPGSCFGLKENLIPATLI